MKQDVWWEVNIEKAPSCIQTNNCTLEPDKIHTRGKILSLTWVTITNWTPERHYPGCLLIDGICIPKHGTAYQLCWLQPWDGLNTCCYVFLDNLTVVPSCQPSISRCRSVSKTLYPHKTSTTFNFFFFII